VAFLRIIDDLDRSLHAEGEILDRENITKWLMQFSAKLPLKLHHPVMGDIQYQGVKFAGSVIAVFDQYVGLTIEDYIERHVRMV